MSRIRRRPARLEMILVALGLMLLVPSILSPQVDFGQIQVQTREIRGGVYLIGNAGGNIAAFMGPEGVFLVDAGYGEMAEKVLAAVAGLAAESGGNPTLRFVANTHWHYDHVTGNEAMARAGATLVAHEGAARLMARDRTLTMLEQEVPAMPPGGRPVVTFNDRINFRWNGDLLHLAHQPLAHSDGDVIVHFRDADVVHMGDLFFNGTYPYIDVDHGGNLTGMVRAIQEILDHTNGTTLFIPGHGPLGTREDLLRYQSMLRVSLERIGALVEEGLSLEEVLEARPTAGMDAEWAPEGSFIDPTFWVKLVYEGLVRAGVG